MLLSFDPGEDCQVDWSHEGVLIDGVTTTVKVAHARVSHSRMPFVRAYLREAQERVHPFRDMCDQPQCLQDGQIVGQHERTFGRDKTIFDPLHDRPVLAGKPGALRNGAPFKEWGLPLPIRRVWRKLERQPGGDRQMVDILSAVLTDGIDAVEEACAEALTHNVHSAGVGLMSWPGVTAEAYFQYDEPPPPLTITTPDALTLACGRIADCNRYDSLRRQTDGTIQRNRRDGEAAALRDAGRL